MRFAPNSIEAQKRMMALIEEIEDQTDRGVAIVGAAWIEETMSAAIESFAFRLESLGQIICRQWSFIYLFSKNRSM